MFWVRLMIGAAVPKFGLRFLCLLSAFVVFFWLNGYFFADIAIADATDRILSTLILLTALAALLSVTVAQRLWATIGIAFHAVNLVIASSFYNIMGHAMSLPDAQMLCHVADNKADVTALLRQCGFRILCIVAAVAFLMGVVFCMRRFVQLRTNKPLFALNLAVILCYGIRFLVSGVVALPANFTPSVDAATLAAFSVVEVAKPHEPELSLESVAPDRAVRHIVLVIDESIEARAFAPLFERAAPDNARDFGIAYSYGNCSDLSNVMLRRGFNPLDAGRASRQPATLFELAKRRGFTTAFLDAQDALKNRYFDSKERAAVDMLPDVRELGPSRYDRDLVAVKVVTRMLTNTEKGFIILDKMGSHFPYRDRLPPEEADTANPYQASLQRTSVNFLRRLAEALPAGTLIFYTSDHGQNFQGRFTHCNAPGISSVSEWTVPLVVLYSKDLTGSVDRMDSSWRDRASHAVIAETIRNLMGYRLPGAASLLVAPQGEQYHRAFYGPPTLPLLYGHPFLIINKSAGRFEGASSARTRS